MHSSFSVISIYYSHHKRGYFQLFPTQEAVNHLSPPDVSVSYKQSVNRNHSVCILCLPIVT